VIPKALCAAVDAGVLLQYPICVALCRSPFSVGRKDVILAKRTRKTAPAETQKQPQNPAARDFALVAAHLAKDRHCTDVVVLDLHGVSLATDYFVVATGTSDRQMRSLADEISGEGRKMGFGRFGRAGYDQAHWILLDYIDVVVHLFTEEYRKFYDLEMLWADAKKIDY
jgi:ribosome-associated protein